MSLIDVQPVWERLEEHLPRVTRPARYIGCERNLSFKHPEAGQTAFLLVYPDTYEVGQPNLGLHILWEILNERPDCRAERAYSPWRDLDAVMREEAIPLFSLDNHLPAEAFDVWAFSVAAELITTNILQCLDLGGVPWRSADRRETFPLVMAGGHVTFNPEPIAPFVDVFVIGDGEEAIGDVADVVGEAKRDGWDKPRLLRALAAVPGLYVPALYEQDYDGDRVVGTRPIEPGVPDVVHKRTVEDLGDWPYPKTPPVPLTEVVHDRLNVEIFRGCTRGCRFCQAGMITRPVRERPAAQVRDMIASGLAATGYEDVSLLSLSSADMSGIGALVEDVMDCHGGDRVALSLPSLRVDAFTVDLAGQLSRVRRTGLTFAPEAGTWRMRRVINKLITEDDLFSAVEGAFREGWHRVKLYFMIGLPTETDEDVLGIADLGRRVVEIGRRYTRKASATLSVGGFVPKAHTPFAWAAQDRPEELDRKVRLLRDATRGTGAQLRWHDPRATLAEGLVARGDRRMADVIEYVYRAGGTFQEWSECFDLSLWLAGMEAAGLSVDALAHRERDADEVFPWEHVSAGLHKDFLWQDYLDSLEAGVLADCRWTPCYDCGVCTGYGIMHMVASEEAPAGGSQGTGQELAPVPIVLRTTATVGAAGA